MNFVYYNPATMFQPSTTINNAQEVSADEMKFALLRKPYASKADALLQDYSGIVYFYDNGILYKAQRIGAWQYKPCTDVECNGGINWDTYYATTAERLLDYLTERYETLSGFAPTLNSRGLYEIQVHYDGRCR